MPARNHGETALKVAKPLVGVAAGALDAVLIQLAHGAMKARKGKVSVKSAEQMPVASAVYLGLDPLNHSLDLMTRILNGEKDGRGFERRYGEGGSE